jgi:CRP-like cAMP-binding protein
MGSLLVPPVALLFGPQGAAIALGLLLPAIAAIAVLRFARIDARITLPLEEIAALRLVPMFAPLGAAPLEAVARHLALVPVTAGQVVIRQGDPGDRWYLVRSGTFAVTIAGSLVNDRGPGDAFGEIALLRDVPRTATVTAVTDGQLWALDREEFLAAVTGSPQALYEAERTIRERMAA